MREVVRSDVVGKDSMIGEHQQPTTESGTVPVLYHQFLRQFRAAPPGKLFSLHGSSAVFKLSLYAAAHALLRGIPIALVDGTNRFDAYYLAEFARRVTAQRLLRRRVTPEELLERIFVARAFTCYQMEATITERLPAFLKQRQAPIAVIFGLLDTFYDEQAPLFEVKAGLQRITAALQRLKQENISVLLTSMDVKLASSERNMLFPRVNQAMDRVFWLDETSEGWRIHEGNKPWSRGRAEEELPYRKSDRSMHRDS